jgi:hypothetical protein
LNRFAVAAKLPTPSLGLRASIVRPSPRLMATCAFPGLPAEVGGVEK